MNISDSNIQLLGRYLSGNISSQEREIVELWIDESVENRNMYEEFQDLWKHSGVRASFYEIDVNEAWNKLNARIEEEELVLPASVEPQRKSPHIKRFAYAAARVAAVLVIAFGLYFIFGQSGSGEMIRYASNQVQQDPFLLPDHSKVFLNKAAHIDYPEQFSSDQRLVQFEGQAYFDIAHNPDKPFIIATGNLRVKVLGTSFTLCSCADREEVVLHLETGKVLFYTVNPDDESVLEQIVLHPGQKGIYNKSTGLLSREEFNGQNHKAWKSGVLEFVKAPLTDVFKSLERTYDIQVVTERSYDDLYLTARYQSDTPDQIFESLHLIFGLDYTISDQKVSLK